MFAYGLPMQFPTDDYLRDHFFEVADRAGPAEPHWRRRSMTRAVPQSRALEIVAGEIRELAGRKGRR